MIALQNNPAGKSRESKEPLAHSMARRGIVPICANCKRIRDDQGHWSQAGASIAARSETMFSHGFCPECVARLYPEFAGSIITQPEPGQ